MKNSAVICLFTFLSLAANAEGLFKKIDLSLCNNINSKCLQIKAEQASGSSIKPLIFIKNLELNWKDSKFKEFFKFGYIDFESNQIILKKLNQHSQLVESVIDMTTLEKNFQNIK